MNILLASIMTCSASLVDFRVEVDPPDAVLTINGQRSVQTGAVRTFQQTVAPGTWDYDISVEWPGRYKTNVVQRVTSPGSFSKTFKLIQQNGRWTCLVDGWIDPALAAKTQAALDRLVSVAQPAENFGLIQDRIGLSDLEHLTDQNGRAQCRKHVLAQIGFPADRDYGWVTVIHAPGKEAEAAVFRQRIQASAPNLKLRVCSTGDARRRWEWGMYNLAGRFDSTGIVAIFQGPEEADGKSRVLAAAYNQTELQQQIEATRSPSTQPLPQGWTGVIRTIHLLWGAMVCVIVVGTLIAIVIAARASK